MSRAVGQVLAMVRVATLRLVRDRGNIFFVFIMPLVLVLLIGTQFGGEQPTLTLAVSTTDLGTLGEDLVDDLEALEDVAVERFPDGPSVVDAVARGDATGGLVIPPGYDRALRSGPTGVVLEFIGRPDSLAPVLQSQVVSVVGQQNQRITLADLVIVVDDDVSYAQALAQADAALAVLPEMSVTRTEAGADPTEQAFAGLGVFDLGAVQQLLLFVFLTSLASAAALLQSREYGVTRRLLAHPTTAGTILLGETFGRFGIALLQGAYLILGTLLLFGVDWGDPLSTLVILVAFGAASAGAGMLLGAVARTQQQAAAGGVGIGLVVAALGGSMLPLELIPDSVRTVSWLTPHAWAYDAYAEVVRHDATVVDVLPQLGVLAGMAVVLLTVASVLLRRALTRGS